ncbi:unnamed protein product [marine sediment metagenome]|uniref:Uncharacterized protein n=2 Tax=marine sediment metagenome TaxID=412755 RepID=X1E425_9ZZZZ
MEGTTDKGYGDDEADFEKLTALPWMNAAAADQLEEQGEQVLIKKNLSFSICILTLFLFLFSFSY